MLAFLGLPGGSEWIIILIVALLLFGPRLPSIMRGLGKGIVEFKRGLRDTEDEVKKELKDAEDEVDKAVEEKPRDQLKG